MAQLDPIARRDLLKRVAWVVPVVLTVALSSKAFAQYENPGPPV